MFFFFKQKTAYEMRISDWSSDVCSSDLVRAALTADPAWRDGWFAEPPLRGLRAMGRLYAGWAMSQTFYRRELWRGLGFDCLEDFLVAGREGTFRRQIGRASCRERVCQSV